MALFYRILSVMCYPVSVTSASLTFLYVLTKGLLQSLLIIPTNSWLLCYRAVFGGSNLFCIYLGINSNFMGSLLALLCGLSKLDLFLWPQKISSFSPSVQFCFQVHWVRMLTCSTPFLSLSYKSEGAPFHIHGLDKATDAAKVNSQ